MREGGRCVRRVGGGGREKLPAGKLENNPQRGRKTKESMVETEASEQIGGWIADRGSVLVLSRV